MDLPPPQYIKSEGMQSRRTSKFLVVGIKKFDILIYKIAQKNQKQTIIQLFSSQNLKSSICSVASTIVTSQDINSISQKVYYIFVGMDNGTLIRMQYDKNMKKIGHKVFNIGSKPVRVKRTSLGSKKQDSIMIISQKCYLYYIYKGKYVLSLLAYPNLEVASQMKQNQNPNGLITYGDGNLCMLSIDSLGQQFHQEKVDLFFSGKKLITFQNNVGIIQADPSYEKAMKNRSRIQTDVDIESNIIQIQNLQKNWKSQFTIYKVKDAKKICAIYFDQTKQICLCAAYNNIKNGNQKGSYLIFGCAQGIVYYPKFQAKQQTIKVYSWITIQKKENQKQNQYKTQFLYSLNIDAIPLVMEPFFKGQKILAGIGKSLRLYEIGKKKLLTKAEVKNLPSNVNQIKTIGKKIFVTSVSDSYHLFKYIPEEHTFYDIAQDHLPKFITAMNVIDSQTVCAGDKFGNLFIGRLTQNAKNEFQTVSATSKPSNAGNLYKFNTLASINVGQIVTSINKVTLFSSKLQVILYSTIMGQLRVLYPLTQYEQVKLIPLLQQKIMQKYKIKKSQGNNWGSTTNIIKADYVQRYLSLSDEQQKQIIREMKIISQEDLQSLRELIEGIRQKII